MPRWNASDFVGFWVPAKLAASGRAVAAYDQHLLATLEQTLSGRNDVYLPWIYPPIFLLLILPLGLMAYTIAFIVYVSAGLIVYGAALAKLAGRDGLVLALAFPGVMVCIYNGHAEFLLAGLFGGALLLIDQRPYIAGLLMGLCAVKPHLFLMVPVALVAGRRWRAVMGAAVMLFLAGAVSVAVLGAEVWRDFFFIVSDVSGDVARNAASFNTVLAKQQSAFAFGYRFGGATFAAAAQAVIIALAGVAVAFTWARDRPLQDRSVVLCCSTLLASPYLFDYDLVLLAVPIALLARGRLARGFLPWEKSLLSALWVIPALARTCSYYASLPVTLILLGLSVAACISSPSPARPIPSANI